MVVTWEDFLCYLCIWTLLISRCPLCFSFKMPQCSINYGCSLVSASELICKHSFSFLGHKYVSLMTWAFSGHILHHLNFISVGERPSGLPLFDIIIDVSGSDEDQAQDFLVKYYLSSDFNTLSFKSVSFHFILFSIIFFVTSFFHLYLPVLLLSLRATQSKW